MMIDELLAWLRDYAERRINSRLIDERRSLPPNIVLDFGNRGIFGLQAPSQYGGLGLNHTDALRVYVQLAAIDPTIATLVFLHNTNGLRPILHHAKPALRDALMPLLAQGRELAAFTLSEPGAGSNLGALETRATPDGDGWRLDGVKRWNGSAWTGVISVFARTVDAAGKLRGLTGFVVRQSDPGVIIGPESLTMGIRGIMQNAVEFRGVHVTPAQVLGADGGGMAVVNDVLSHGRLATASVALGAALRAVQLTDRYVSRRQVDTGLLLENPQTGVALSDIVHRIAIDHALLMHAAERLDRGERIVPEVAMAIKVAATETGIAATELAMQLLGGRGYMENNIVPQLVRDARMLSIGEGANEGLVAATGRGVRMTDTTYDYLRSMSDRSIVDRLRKVSGELQKLGDAGRFTQSEARAWHDAQLGRAAIAALRCAISSASGLAAHAAWAKVQYDDAIAAATTPSAKLTATLSPNELRVTIKSYGGLIGNIEPQAPDVDLTLDPLLRRDGGTDPAPRTPS